MGALSFLTTIFAPAESLVEVNPRRCLRNRLRGNRCKLCLQICPTAALSYSDGSLHFDKEACSNCLGCTAVCPVDALVPSVDLQKFVNQAKEAKQDDLIISCEHSRLFCKDEVVLPCLGVFSYELLISVVAAALQKRILFNIEGCSDCPNGRVSRRFQGNLTSLLQHSDDTAVAEIKFVTGESGELVQDDRRSFFKKMRHDAINAASSRKGERQTTEKSATARTISSKSALLKKTYESMEIPHPLVLRMLPRLSIGENCEPCPRCTGICPTGALKLVRAEHGKKLDFDTTSCCSCGLCVDFCKEEALALSCSLTI